ncbi:hypothetical protein M8J75_008208 [Diaphorina citri]|nr:hypothetical protein M8J75_008208 [Diaphorina citri]
MLIVYTVQRFDWATAWNPLKFSLFRTNQNAPRLIPGSNDETRRPMSAQCFLGVLRVTEEFVEWHGSKSKIINIRPLLTVFNRKIPFQQERKCV